MIRNRLWIASLCVVSTLVLSCSQKISNQVAKTDEVSMEEKINALAAKQFESGYKIAYNASKTFALVSKSFKTRKNETFATLSLLIYDGAGAEIIFQETIPKASASWISDEEVEVSVVSGMLADDKQAKDGFIFHVKEKRKKAR
ncbi:MAG: hypothetical protein HRU41_20605 [Saprospiraceae bacterium]|nr:hypothetical protein [Saprospiraceae bacterium]